MALDEPTNDDLIEEISGLTFLVDKKLQEKYKGFEVKAVPYLGTIGFQITPDLNPVAGGCSSCSSCD